MKQRLLEELKQFKSDIRSIKCTKDLLGFIPVSALQKIAYWLLLAVIASPLYVLFRSLFLLDRDPFYLNTNQRILGSYWLQLFQIIGYSGIFLTFLFLVIYLANRGEKGWLINALRKHKVPLFLFLLLLWSVLSYAFSSDRMLSLKGNFYRFEGLITYFAYAGIFCCGYLITDAKKRISLMKLNVIIATLLAVLTLLNVDALNSLLSLKHNAAIFQNINHYAYYLCLSIMVAGALVIRESKLNWKMIFWLVAYGLLTVMLIKNNSFGPYLAVVAGLVFLAAFMLISVRKSWLPVVLLIVVFALLTVGFNLKSNFFTHETKKLTTGITSIFENNENADSAGSGRWILWVRAAEYTLEKPFFGYGPDNLSDRYLADKIECDRAHNDILQMSASLGIPAALFYCCAIFFYFLQFVKSTKRLNADTVGPVAAIFTWLVSSMFSVSVYYTMPFYFAFLGLTSNLFHDIETAT